MKAIGERIIIFGDSLSKHGHDSSPEIWDVNQGSDRPSSSPGDLMASMLAEAGAEAVRVNARVSRSAWNFWSRENTGALIGSDANFRPTKVVIMLGTNDVGLNAALDREAFTRLRDTYRAMGAEVWAIGPFANTSKPDAGVEQVAQTMKAVFGGRFIDGRIASQLVAPGRDGLHYDYIGARQLALALTDLLISKISPTTLWGSIAFGVLGIGAAAGIGWAWKRKQGQALLGDMALPKVSRDTIDELIQGDDPNGLDIAQDALLQRGDRVSEIAKTGGSIDQHTWANYRLDLGQDARIAWKVTKDSMGRCTARFATWAPGGQHIGASADSPLRRIDSRGGVRESKESVYTFEEGYYGEPAYCERAAASTAWAMAKVLKREPKMQLLTQSGLIARAQRINEEFSRALDQDNSEPKELYGLDAPQGETKIWRLNPVTGLWAVAQGTVLEENAQEYLQRFEKSEPGVKFKIAKRKPRAPKNVVSAGADLDAESYHKYVEEHLAPIRRFNELTRDLDPASMEIAEDFVEENGLKLSRLTMDETAPKALKQKLNVGGEILLSPLDPADAPRTAVRWTIKPAGTHADDPSAVVDWEVIFNDKIIRIDGAHPRRAKDVNEMLQLVAADGWAMAKRLKALPPDTVETRIRHDAVDALYPDFVVEDGSPEGRRSFKNADKKPHLYGVNIVDGKRYDGDTNALVRKGYRPEACKSGLDKKGLAKCWTKEITKAIVANAPIGDLGGVKIGAEFRRKGNKTPWTVAEIVKPERTVGTLKIGETVRVTDGKTSVEITNAQGAWIDGQGRRWNWLGGGVDGLDGARRRPEMETRVKETDPGSRPPRYGDLHIGREKADGYKDLPWKRVITEAKKEREKNPDGGANLRLSMRVGHAPDAHTPPTFVDWDPLDEKGAVAFAKQLIDDGAMYADVRASAERPYMRGDRNPPKGVWTLASFESDTIPLEGLSGMSGPTEDAIDVALDAAEADDYKLANEILIKEANAKRTGVGSQALTVVAQCVRPFSNDADESFAARGIKQSLYKIQSASPSGRQEGSPAIEHPYVIVSASKAFSEPETAIFPGESDSQAIAEEAWPIPIDPAERGAFADKADWRGRYSHIEALREMGVTHIVPCEGSELFGDSSRDDTIAWAIQDSASRAPTWAASRKVFISDLFEQLKADNRDDGMSLDDFKAELARLHKAGKLKLARADLVAAMPPDKVAASELDTRVSTFHFVNR